MRKVALSVVLGSLCTGFGCTALLGEFEVNPSGSSGLDANPVGEEASLAPDGSASDAPLDGYDPESTVFSACGVSQTRIIDQVDTVDASTAGFDGFVQAVRIGNAVRAVVRKRSSQGAFVYTFDPKSGNSGSPVASQQLGLGDAGQFLDVRRRPGPQSATVLLFLERDKSAPVARMMVYELPDGNLGASQAARVSADFPTPPTGANVSGALGLYAVANEYFWAMSKPSAGNAYDLVVGRKTTSALPPPVLIYSGEERDVRVRHMARSQTTQYLFNDRGPDTPTDRGSSFFAVPQDTVTDTLIKPASLTPQAGGKPFATLTVSGEIGGDGLRAAVAEIDFSGTAGAPGQLRIGEVPQAELAALSGAKVPPAFTLGSLLEAPLSKMEARFFGEEFLWIGSPPEPQRGQGLNFIWFNIRDRIIRSRQVGPQKMLANRPSITGQSIWLVSSTPFSAELDLVFTEEFGNKSLLEYATVNCVR